MAIDRSRAAAARPASTADRTGANPAERSGASQAERAGASQAERAGASQAERAGASQAERAGASAPTADRPRTSVLISSRGRPDFLSAVVASLQAGDDVPDEIVIVDQSAEAHPTLGLPDPSPPGEGTAPIVRYRWHPDRGLSRGRNEALTIASGELLVFVDDDVTVPPDWFGRIVAAAVAAGPGAVITGRVVAGDAERPGAFAPSLSIGAERVVHRGRPGCDVLLPLNMALFRSAFEAVGPFDERLGAGARFPSSEDNDLGFRLLEAGFEIIHDPAVVVVHRAWRPPSALLPLRWSYGRGQGAYFAKHASRHDAYMADRLRRDVWRHLRRAPRRALRDPLAAAGDFVYALAVLAGAAEWLARRHVPAARTADR